MNILQSYKIINDNIELIFKCPKCNNITKIIISLNEHKKYNSGALAHQIFPDWEKEKIITFTKGICSNCQMKY